MRLQEHRALQLVTGPTVEVLTTAQAKAHLRVTTTDEDTLIDDIVKAARRAIEDYSKRAMIDQTWLLRLDTQPRGPTLELPRCPLRSVTHVKHTTDAGVLTTYAATNYIVDTVAEPGRIVLKTGSVWPEDLQPGAALEVTFVAGYGVAASSVPDPLIGATKLLVGHLFEHREGLGEEDLDLDLPLLIRRIVGPYRIWWA